MEEIVEKIQSSLEVTGSSSSKCLETGETSTRLAQYKYSNKVVSSCDARRRVILEEQKQRRDDVLNKFRGLLDKVLPEEKTCMEWSHKNQYRKTNTLLSKELCSQIMFSEWFLDVPSDFKSDWCFKACPKGRRMLLVTKNGRTWSFSKNGHLVRSFQSHLPGGNRRSCTNVSVVLDTIYSPDTTIYYILDVLVWKFPVMSSTAEFRFYWLATKMNEINQEPSDVENKYEKLSVLPAYPTTSLEECLSVHPWFPDDTPELDGLLFYHKLSFYEPGRTPLVSWIKPFMVSNIIGIPVHEAYLNGYDCDVLKVMEAENRKYYKKHNQWSKIKVQLNNMEVDRSANVKQTDSMDNS